MSRFMLNMFESWYLMCEQNKKNEYNLDRRLKG